MKVSQVKIIILNDFSFLSSLPSKYVKINCIQNWRQVYQNRGKSIFSDKVLDFTIVFGD